MYLLTSNFLGSSEPIECTALHIRHLLHLHGASNELQALIGRLLESPPPEGALIFLLRTVDQFLAIQCLTPPPYFLDDAAPSEKVDSTA